MISGMMKYYRVGLDTLLYDISFSNIILLSATIPDYGKEDKGNGGGETISADDPANNERIIRALGL